MGTITTRRRKNGTNGFTAQIRIKRGGKAVFTESRMGDQQSARGDADEGEH